jgi:5'-nucleotidase
MFSSRVLLDLEKADQIFKDKGLDAYRRYMVPTKRSSHYDAEVGGRRLNKGPLFDFAEAALKLNEAAGEPIFEIGLSCKDEVDTAVPIFRSLDVQGLDEVGYRIAKSGKNLSIEDHIGFGTDLLLSRNSEDVQFAINNGIAAATIYTPPSGFDYNRKEGPIRLWVDGDAVAFGSSSEVRYREEGLEVYREMESKEFDVAVESGPFTDILVKISELNQRFEKGQEPFELSLLTARGGNAGARALSIASHHGINFNGGTYFMSGADKVGMLKAHKPDIFFDDQMVHLEQSANYCPTGLVAYEEGGPMYEFQQKEKLRAQKKSELKENVSDTTSDKADQKIKKTKPVIKAPKRVL